MCFILYPRPTVHFCTRIFVVFYQSSFLASCHIKINACLVSRGARDCTGMSITGIPRNPWNSRGDESQCCGVPAEVETNVVGLPPGWKNILRDSRGNDVAVFDFAVQLNPPCTSFVCETMSACLCLITMITQTGTSVSVIVVNHFFYQ